jgi:hypothetical protein
MGSVGKKSLSIAGTRVQTGDVLNLLSKLTSLALKEAAETSATIPEDSYILKSSQNLDPSNSNDRAKALEELLQKHWQRNI